MWSIRTLSYGGLTRRYRDFHGGVLRCMDPLRDVPVAFSTELKYENWLLYWADPLIRKIDVGHAWIEYMSDGMRVRMRPDLVIKRERTELQLVLPQPAKQTERRISALIQAAQALDCDWRVRTRDDIRRCPLLLVNLKRLRQCAAMYADHVNVSDLAFVAKLLPSAESLTCREIAERIPSRLRGGLLDAILIHLHWRGRILIDLTGRAYGDHTTVRCR